MQAIKNTENNIPVDTDNQIRARNIVTDRTSLEFNKMKTERPIDRSPSNFLLQGFASTQKFRQMRNMTNISKAI